MSKTKQWWKSKTVWFNILACSLEIVNEFNGKLIPTEYAVTIIAVGNIVLRFVTNSQVIASKKKY